MKKTLLSIALAAVAMLPNVAQAQTNPTDNPCGDIVVNGLLAPSPYSLAAALTPCDGLWAGNDDSDATLKWLEDSGYEMELIGKTESSSTGPFQWWGDLKSGDILFNIDPETGLPRTYTGPLAVTLKFGSGNNDNPGGYATYIFNSTEAISGFRISADSPLPLGLSHAVLYRGSSTVPEPATFGLVAAGMIGLAGVARRRRNQA